MDWRCVAVLVACSSVAAVRVTAAQPADQAAFSSLPHTLQSQQSAAPNDIVRSQLRNAAPGQFCAKFKQMLSFRGWIATVKDITASSLDNSAEIKLDIGNGVSITQKAGASTPLYQQLAKLQEGQSVIVSGTFDHSNDVSACTYYFGPFDVFLSSIRPG